MKSGLILKNPLISRRILVEDDDKQGDDHTGNTKHKKPALTMAGRSQE